MILPTTLLLGALGYLFYTSKKEFSLDTNDPLENEKETDDLYTINTYNMMVYILFAISFCINSI